MLNKIDNLAPKEIEEIIAFNKQVLEEMGVTVDEILPISAREALKAKKPITISSFRKAACCILKTRWGGFFLQKKGK